MSIHLKLRKNLIKTLIATSRTYEQAGRYKSVTLLPTDPSFSSCCFVSSNFRQCNYKMMNGNQCKAAPPADDAADPPLAAAAEAAAVAAAEPP